MTYNLNRKIADALFTQSKLNFGKTQKVQTSDQSIQTEPSQSFIECSIFSFEIVRFKSNCQIESFELFKTDAPKPKPIVEEIKETFQCNECEMVFSYKHTLKRHLEKQHQDNQNIYFKHEKVDGKYACTTCEKTSSHSRDLKHHMAKKHQTEFQVIDAETKLLIPAKRKSRFIETEKEKREHLKRQKLFEEINQPADNSDLVVFQIRLIEIPSLAIIEQKDLLKNYLHVATPLEPTVHCINQFAYKINPLQYLVERQGHAIEFAYEYTILKESKIRGNINLLYLDGTIFAGSYIALRLPYYEVTLRDYLRTIRDPIELPDILFQAIQGVKELYKMGYVHRDLKPDNIMIRFNPLKVAVIDFNRAIRKKNTRLGNALGTPGYFPIRAKWLDGSLQWDIWAIAAIILECDLEKDEYFKTETEEKAKGIARLHLSYENVCKHLKDVVTKIILKAPKYPNFSLEYLEQAVQGMRFQKLSTDKKVKFV